MKNIIRNLFLFTTLIFGGSLLQAQDIEDIKEFFTFYPNYKAAERDSTLYLQKFIVAPVVSYTPETNFGLGMGAKYLFKFNGSGEETRVSNMPITAQYTLNNQFFLFSGFEIFTNQEKWVIEGNILFQNYPRIFYGIGNEAVEENEEQYDYTQFLFEPIFLKQMLTRYLFIGGGLRYNHIFDTNIEEGKIIDQTRPDGYDGSTSFGAEVAALYDSRDVILNAQKGWYLEFTHGKYFEALGGTNSFNLTRLDLRYFLGISEKNRDVLAFQFVGRTTREDLPFSEYSFFGSPEIMRGYQEGRFVDRDLLASQVEYRKRFGESRWGAVAFLGAGNVYRNVDEFQFANLKPNYGLGLRWMLDKKENLNIRLDWGFGQGTNNIYLGIAEAF
ncbi:BamA/TamA family outer membrane protein [Nonlabens xiamenensis]|uniref:BamA/TamA family outer membrane protein n=1 Tax=Nonlabens xiamenensis TaxID=2341043 RepID=UPI0029392FD4|nr:BamA/TamA family outer membrane protein [Nonlabens xiamenensis]